MRTNRSRRLLLTGVLGSTLLASSCLDSCVYPATEVIVVLDTDAPRDRFMTVHLSTQFDHEDGGIEHLWQRGPNAAGSIAFPASFAIVPGRLARDSAVTLRIEARVDPPASGGDAVVFTREASFHLTPQRTATVGIFLPLACGAPAAGCTSVASAACTTSIACEDRGLTCGNEGLCVSIAVAPVPGNDAGAFRPDAARDGMSIDAPPDASDSGLADASDANDGFDAPADVPMIDAGPCDGAGTCWPGSTQSCRCNGTQTCTAMCAWGSCRTGCSGGQVCGSGGSCCTSSCPGRCSYNACTGAVCDSCPGTNRCDSPSTCRVIGSVNTVCNNPGGTGNQCDCPAPLSPCCGGSCC